VAQPQAEEGVVILPPDLDAALYCELINRPPSAPDALRMTWGPSEQFRLLELEREKWATLALFGDDEEAGAA
jgi:hypothetical protein